MAYTGPAPWSGGMREGQWQNENRTIMYLHARSPACGQYYVRRSGFAYSEDRKGELPAIHLANFRGTLQADGYAGFNRLYEAGSVIESACWAHVGRKFQDLFEAHASPIAKDALEPIAT